MKVYFSGYRDHWLSPYTILEKVFYWREIDYDEPIIEKWSNRLNPLCVAAQKFLDFVHPKVEYVKIDYYDTWNMDSTLSKIIYPMLVQLNEKKHGAPFTEDEDAPEELRSTSAPAKENEWDTDANHFKRWDWIMGEMIWAFEQKNIDWEEQYREGKIDWKSVPCAWDAEGKPTLYSMEDGPNNTYKCDYAGMKVHQARIDNGVRLFGKYYQGLWD
jgi:hypothetical protein